jgi:hypothetical protein
MGQPPAVFGRWPAASECVFVTHDSPLEDRGHIKEIKMMPRALLSVATVLFFVATSLPGQVFAQPAGNYLLQSYHVYSDCSINSTTSFSLERIGREATCAVYGSPNSLYRECNSTHVVQYTCTDLECSVGCTVTTGMPFFSSSFRLVLPSRSLRFPSVFKRTSLKFSMSKIYSL